jgi:hypothetical protein
MRSKKAIGTWSLLRRSGFDGWWVGVVSLSTNCERVELIHSNLCSGRLQVISLSSPSPKNISVRPRPKSVHNSRRSVPTEGRIAIVTNAGRDAVDAAALGARSIADRFCRKRWSPAKTNNAFRGRRSRVVLTPRCWRQACGVRKRRWQ